MGRTREFDLEDAVDRALQVFWRKGYEGTSLTDLTDALGINRPSLYAAFGNKEELFYRALERYAVGPGSGLEHALAAPTAREAAFRILRFYADAVGMPERPKGCMLVQSALVCSDASESVQRTLVEKRLAVEAALVARFERGKHDGELPASAKPADLGRYVWTVCFGLSVQANGGATREQLRRVVDLTMQSWPV